MLVVSRKLFIKFGVRTEKKKKKKSRIVEGKYVDRLRKMLNPLERKGFENRKCTTKAEGKNILKI